LDFPTDNFSKRRIGKDLQVCTRNTRLIKLSHFGIRKICENFKSNARPDRHVCMIYIYICYRLCVSTSNYCISLLNHR
jgi:hypothetical protein